MNKSLLLSLFISLTYLFVSCEKENHADELTSYKNEIYENDTPDSLNPQKVLKSSCTSNCLFGDCSASGDYTTCRCPMGFPRCKARDVQGISFGNGIENEINNTILNIQATSNPSSQVAIEKLENIYNLIKDGVCVNCENYESYISLIDEFEEFMNQNFTDDEINSIFS